MITFSDSERARIVAEAEAWAAADLDLETRAELEALLATEDIAILAECFAGPLTFGTAGVRGVLGPGPSRMNVVTIAAIGAGLARQLLADLPGSAEAGVVLGRDARHGSDKLARTLAEVLAGHGMRVHWIEEPCPTPVVAFWGLHVGAASIGVVTASHNPPRDNGFKVYSERGYQIVPPQDNRIREEADRASAEGVLPRVPFHEALADGRIIPVDPEELEERYLDALDTQCLGTGLPPEGRGPHLTAVSTSLHGVGQRWVLEALARRGFHAIFPVWEQAEPDGDFPTVAFPNPEEPGALDLALSRARATDADLVVANDPDTDRLCVAVRDTGRESGYRVLTGNELGVLFGEWLLGERARRGELAQGSFVCTTIVSTTMLARIAWAYGCECEVTLTGLKWVWDRAYAREAAGETFLFGFEEAIGYCIGGSVRDKDGIGAAQAIMEMAAHLKAHGRTLAHRLAELEVRHGIHLTRQVSGRLPGREGQERMDALMARLRSDPPESIGGERVEESLDLETEDADGLGLPRSNVLLFSLGDAGRIVVRPSGTEPKIKAYIEMRERVAGPSVLESSRARASERADRCEVWLQELIDVATR